MVINFAKCECWVPFVNEFAFVDTADERVLQTMPEAHVIWQLQSPDGKHLVTLCWVFSWNVLKFLRHVGAAIATADDGYLDMCQEFSEVIDKVRGY